MPRFKDLSARCAAGALTAAIGATLAFAPSSPATPTAPSAASAPDRSVTVQVSLRDAANREVRAFSCHWAIEPEPDDRECMKVVGDPPKEIGLIREAGAHRSVVVVTTGGGMRKTSGFTPRSDGTWLGRGAGQFPGGRHFEWGFVCDRDGRSCVPWTALDTTVRAAVRDADRKMRVKAARRAAR
jgi:hypothetical protein